MALADFCRLDEKVNLKPIDSLSSFENDIIGYSGNFAHSAQLANPPFHNPAQTLAQFSSKDETGRDIKINFDHGTTTLGFRYQGGVLLAVDSRATGGQFIGSQSMKKIVEINDYLLAKQCRLYELRNRERISVAAASKLMANMVYNYKGMGLSMGMMLAGYDKRGAQLYYVDSEGTRTPGKVFSVGSGSVYAFGVLDTGYRWDLTDIWRPITALFYYPITPNTGFHFMVNCYFLYSYSERLETGMFGGKPADYCYMLCFNTNRKQWFPDTRQMGSFGLPPESRNPVRTGHTWGRGHTLGRN
ncbi:hypothetical protein MSG28_013756 [Choristoneura fumiferana]|uniref:Uncharacterized protein n=1 Tax=Choristoneura fumiferana TaxID=7141 RepID=A0ACC0K8R5_CHOFU|nr:hypothetical protein MSG28_013756 [Choristoneura fumiferana]